MRKTMAGLAAALLGAGAAAAQDAPGWLKLLRWISGDSNRTSVPIHMMGPHMQMSMRQPERPGDRERAAGIVEAARAVLGRYPTVEAAQRDGYRPFHETGTMGEEVHLTSIGRAYAEGRRIDYDRPGSILYRRTPQGLKPVGVMYGAPGQADAAALDRRAPLSVASWHRHVNFCWALGREREAENRGPRFGYDGSISDEATCRRGGGYWLPIAFGWMTHVYPDRAQPFGGEEMRPGEAMAHEHH